MIQKPRIAWSTLLCNMNQKPVWLQYYKLQFFVEIRLSNLRISETDRTQCLKKHSECKEQEWISVTKREMKANYIELNHWKIKKKKTLTREQHPKYSLQTTDNCRIHQHDYMKLYLIIQCLVQWKHKSTHQIKYEKKNYSQKRSIATNSKSKQTPNCATWLSKITSRKRFPK